MAITSTVTTSVAHDHTLGDDSELLNHMCVLAIARDDGNLFDATSIQEDGIIELCVKVRWAHPEGVLQLSAMELVIGFQSSKEMLAVVHMVMKAMAWHEEPIKLHTSPPFTAHLRAYIAGKNAWPLGTESPTPEGEEVPQSPLVTPTLMGGSHTNSTWTSGTLAMLNSGSWLKTFDRR